jgi:hypothetical protein
MFLDKWITTNIKENLTPCMVMDMRNICTSLVAGSEPPHKKHTIKGILPDTITFLAIFAVVIFTILFGQNFINLYLVVLFVVLLLVLLLRKVKTYSISQKEINIIYCGAAAVFVSVTIFSIWLGYCIVLDRGYCQYIRYILCGEIGLLFLLVVLFFRRGQPN